MKTSAAEIRKGTVFLKLEENYATDEEEKDLEASINELEKLADAVEKDSIRSTRELDQAFAHAHFALAKNYQLKCG